MEAGTKEKFLRSITEVALMFVYKLIRRIELLPTVFSIRDPKCKMADHSMSNPPSSRKTAKPSVIVQ